MPCKFAYLLMLWYFSPDNQLLTSHTSSLHIRMVFRLQVVVAVICIATLLNHMPLIERICGVCKPAAPQEDLRYSCVFLEYVICG